MKVLITGSNGFVGKNLLMTLESYKDLEILTYTRDNTYEELRDYCSVCDFVIHLAGVNRTTDSSDFYNVNADLTDTIIKNLEESNNIVPVMISSSIQAELDNDYGKSKKLGEDKVREYGIKNNVPVYIYRLPNLFGKWSKPFYNSVVATWCHQISRDEDITLSNREHLITFLYIDDYIKDIIKKLYEVERGFQTNYNVEPTYTKSLGEVSDLLFSFKESRTSRYISDMSDEFTKKLYSTYLSYLDKDNFKYDLITHSDDRGSFTELVKSDYAGQVSINVSKAYESKGEHYHHTKNEKFIVVKGKASIKFRNVLDDEVIEYIVSDEHLEVVDIPTGYTHNITNLTSEDLITVMWVNEPYDPNNPDTFSKLVEEN